MSKDNSVKAPALGFVEMLRWAWTQLTSMRTALFLLLLLAVAAVPGSLFPQRIQNPAAVTKYITDNPGIGEWMDTFQLFDVYSSFWFSAIYLLLFISLAGCVIPRARQHYKQWRAKPPKTPKRLSRLSEYGTLQVPAAAGLSAEDAVVQASKALKKRGYRVVVQDLDTDRPSVAAERGFLKELGNLVFHVSLIGVMIAFAVTGLFGYRGQKVIIEGDTFVNNLVAYDNFRKGGYFNQDSLVPYSVRLDEFKPTFNREQVQYGQPTNFEAFVTTKDSPDSPEKKQVLKVNEPLSLGGTEIYLVGNGYAPSITVRDGNGNVAAEGPVVTLPNDSTYNSTFVMKVPDARPDQLSFVGFFLPTAVTSPNGVAYSADPDPFNPTLNINSYYGDLGLDNGVPSNVYVLDTSKLTPLNTRDLSTGGIVLEAGQTYDLPEGKGSITFSGLQRYIGVDITYDPGKIPALIFSSLALLGLIGSLFIARRRVWVRAGQHPDGRTMVEFGLLARGEDHGLARERDAVAGLLSAAWDLPAPDDHDENRPDTDETLVTASKDNS